MAKRPNILFIMSDDHASHAIGAYNSRINKTPHLDRIAQGGMRLDNCFCTNSICTPSRANILTGKYSHRNRVLTLGDRIDGRQTTFPKLLQVSGYQTAVIGKWHLGHGGHSDPSGFDYWSIFPEQGKYHRPDLIEMGETKSYEGYATDIVTDLSLEWLQNRDRTRPFLLMCHHKAPHRPWEPDAKHAHLYDDIDIPIPETFDDDHRSRSAAAAAATMRIDRDLDERDLKQPTPEGLTPGEAKKWKYQRFIKDYLRCIASVDDNVGRLLDYLDAENEAGDTIVIYTSDQGFFLGDHGWFDKRFMYEESLRMPFLVRYPREIPAGSVCGQFAVNVDFAPTFLDYAGVPIPDEMQGVSLRPILAGAEQTDWQRSMYYRYWVQNKGHNVSPHYGVRTERYKLIYYYHLHEWELFDLHNDPCELNNVYGEPSYETQTAELKAELERLRHQVQDLS